MDIKPFSKLPIIKFFQHDLEKIMMAYRLSDSIRGGVGNIRAAGDEIESAVREFYRSKLYPNYYVGDGHIVDSNLKVSPQFDIIISENRKNPVLFKLADKSDILYFEPVILYGEIKRSYYSNDLVTKFIENINRMNHELVRENLPPNYIDTAGAGMLVNENVTTLPVRNPILKYMFFVDSFKLKRNHLQRIFSGDDYDKSSLPNFIVFLDQGLVVNVNDEAFAAGKVEINLYPEYEERENSWILLPFESSHETLIYHYMLIVDHLNSVATSHTDVLNYTKEMFTFTPNNILRL